MFVVSKFGLSLAHSSYIVEGCQTITPINHSIAEPQNTSREGLMLILYSNTCYSAKQYSPLHDCYIVLKSDPIENTKLAQTSESD